MSKRHQASRRRTYGRRQHEMHERTDRHTGLLSWVDEQETPWIGDRWDAESPGRALAGDWLQLRSID
jgi:hypothetical protein